MTSSGAQIQQCFYPGISSAEGRPWIAKCSHFAFSAPGVLLETGAGLAVGGSVLEPPGLRPLQAHISLLGGPEARVTGSICQGVPWEWVVLFQ